MGAIKTLASPELGSSVFLSLLILEFNGPARRPTDKRPGVCDQRAGRLLCRAYRAARWEEMVFRSGWAPGRHIRRQTGVGLCSDHSQCEIVCRKTPFEAVIYTAPTDQAAPPAHVTPDQVRTVDSGKSDWQRQVYIAMGDDGPAACMMLGETESPPGNWSSFPPHRHMQNNPPQETKLEELYYFKFEPQGGFIIGGIYDDRLPRKCAVENIPPGSGFRCAGRLSLFGPMPRHRVRYAWALGGKTKKFGAWQDDAELAWLHNS